ncbi:hypothetical protein XBI1_1260076 [Xenorhabdus bovienii str. Intermedium]|uniref:Uncharacterized protein n=1 Tax=Xenorhabdus bovienii str. Intermedium TaxID=1379677 RepID=A0A077QD70_XENBV|nr:hypothetical protein XBI1_1260076 [Xenorhabdus bovienii str. Intermedium]
MARLSKKMADTPISRPCSSHVYQVRPTPAKAATSSRLNPGVRRRPICGNPTDSGFKLSLLIRKKLANSVRVLFNFVIYFNPLLLVIV